MAEVLGPDAVLINPAPHHSHPDTVQLTKRGAAHLAEWLLDFARPRRRPVLPWSIAEIAKECKVSSRTAQEWTRRKGFPKKLGNPKCGPIWDGYEVKRWVRHDRPRRGRPARRG